MPLTPQDVSNKRFTPVRLREGYDMGEVDQFLDEVESELSRLTNENEELRARLASSQNGGATGTATGTVPQQAEVKTAVAPSETIKVTTIGEASGAAARLLEIATRNADELVGEAKDIADKIVGEARTKAERLEEESRSSRDRMESEARSRSERLDAETAERRRQVLGDLENDRNALTAELDNLHAFEREYRSRLKNYFTQQLAALDREAGVLDAAGGEDGLPGSDPQAHESAQGPGAASPTPLQTLLAADEPQDQQG
jgi:DivIVA domain-containing protein